MAWLTARSWDRPGSVAASQFRKSDAAVGIKQTDEYMLRADVGVAERFGAFERGVESLIGFFGKAVKIVHHSASFLS